MCAGWRGVSPSVYHSYVLTASETGVIKIVENHEGVTFANVLQVVAMPVPQRRHPLAPVECHRRRLVDPRHLAHQINLLGLPRAGASKHHRNEPASGGALCQWP